MTQPAPLSKLTPQLRDRATTGKWLTWTATLLGAACLFGPGCGDDATLDEVTLTPQRVETVVSVSDVVAGQTVPVSCAVLRGTTVQVGHTDFALVVEPADGVTINGATELVPTRAGELTVACRSQLLEIVDGSPAVVRVSPGQAASLELAPPSDGVVGVPATIDCVARDAFGNAVDVEVSVGSPGASADAEGLTPSAVGETTLTCSAEGLTPVSVPWVVVAGAPVRAELMLDPDQAVVGLGAEVVATVTLYDAGDNVVEAGAVPDELVATPSGLDLAGNVVTAKSTGDYVLTATRLGLDASRPLAVDGTRPALVLDQPDRGTTHGGVGEILVAGKVTDDRGEVALTIGGDPVAVAEDGAFNATVPLGFGVNTLHVEARDAAGNVAETWRAAVWSDEWFALEKPIGPEDRVPKGAALILTQAIFDDKLEPTDGRPKDIADIAEILLVNLDVKALAPDPLTSLLGCDYHLDTFKIEDAEVRITVLDGKVRVEMDLTGFALEISNSGGLLCTFHWGKEPGDWLDGTGPLNISADAMKVVVYVSAKAEDGKAVLDVTVDDIEFNGAFNVDIPVVTDIVDGLFNVVLDIFKGLFGDLVSSIFGTLFESLNLTQALPIPVLGSDTPNTVHLETVVNQILFSEGQVLVELDATAYAEVSKRPWAHLGSPRYTGCGATKPLPASVKDKALIALHDDVLNQLFFAVFDGGSLNLTVTEAALGGAVDLAGFGVKDLVAKVDARLAPVVNSCDGAAQVEIGDLFVDAEFLLGDTPTHMAFWVQGDVGLVLSVVSLPEGGSGIDFELAGLDQLTFEVVTNDGLFAGNDQGLVDLVKGVLIPQLIGGALGDLGPIALPEIALSSIVPGLPEDLVLRIGLETIETGGGLTVVIGGLE